MIFDGFLLFNQLVNFIYYATQTPQVGNCQVEQSSKHSKLSHKQHAAVQ
jgi:hypothetical protein